MRGEEPRTAAEWADVCRRFVEDADKMLAIGSRVPAYDNYGYAVEAAAKALILRLGRLTKWPATGEPYAQDVHTHSVLALIKFAGVFQRFTEDRRRSRQLHDDWLIVKEWFPLRYSTKPPEHRDVARLGRASKGMMTWLNNL
jgi:hypothetical protein